MSYFNPQKINLFIYLMKKKNNGWDLFNLF